ncbi:asparagine synthetase B family protein [Streptomyces sp. NPDC088358]|uniref:asparagine synthetase B family protein n=1 Tax=Streptomyces sp. NPDC088358 TaxID=3365857 RepID=UPI0037F2A53F
MCGLVGYIGFAGHPPRGTEDTSLKEMTETLACRGPDASAVWAEGSAGLGHTRLATVDLVGGRQPMTLARDGRTVLAVAFTGEVYNHAGLRSELTALGHRFTSRSDSEVVLHAIDAWGEEAPARLEGMFAYAAWEPGPRRLTLVRDRFGIKPLSYARTGDAAVFGSEPKAVLAHPAVTARLDLDGLRELLLSAHPMINTPGRSAFAGLREVAPGTVVTVTPEGVRTRRYWSLTPVEHGDDLPTTVARVRELLEEAVTGQLALADPDGRARVGHLRDGLTLGDFDTSLLQLYRAVREDFPVTLAGDGADELFGGYRWFTPRTAVGESFPWDSVLDRADLTRLLDPALAAALDLPAHRAELHRAACAEIEHLPGTSPAEAALRRASHLNLTRFLPCLLDRADRLGMGVGLEVRVPFLDHHLVEYVFNTPWELKTFDGREKSLLRAAVTDLLPGPVLTRRKSPYPMVRDPAYRLALTAQVGRLLTEAGPATDLLDVTAVRGLLLEPTGADRFPREGLELVLDLDHWLRAHRPALLL